MAPLLLERFLVAAVVAVLLIRGWLALTGYPQIGGHGLHIAHMLFGGIGMLIALLASLTFLGPGTREITAIVGGAGFGTFIDELGKFVTSDNDYFYRPTVSMIYIIFVVLFLVAERLSRQVQLTHDDYLAQALDVLSGDVVQGFPARDREVVRQLLAKSDPNNPLVPALRRALAKLAITPDPAPSRMDQIAERVSRSYDWVVGQRWFLRLVLFVAGLLTLYGLREITITIRAEPEPHGINAYIDTNGGLLVLAYVASAALLIVGLFSLRRSLLIAYRWFRRAVLVSLLLTQPLAFYQDEWSALIGLVFNLVLMSALEFGIGQEESAGGTAALAAGADTEATGVAVELQRE
jgi:hypothetical protein